MKNPRCDLISLLLDCEPLMFLSLYFAKKSMIRDWNHPYVELPKHILIIRESLVGVILEYIALHFCFSGFVLLVQRK